MAHKILCEVVVVVWHIKALYNGTPIPVACRKFKTLKRMLLSSPQMADNYVEWQKIRLLHICIEELMRTCWRELDVTVPRDQL